MKVSLQIIALIFLATMFCFGKTKRIPKNLKQAISFLNSDCPDSLKVLIKNTDNKDLKKLTYPFNGKYKTIFEWTNDENRNSKIVRYLNSKRVSYHQIEVILIAFKQFLLKEKIDENIIYKPFQEIEKKWDEEEKVRYTIDSLRGIYIPKDLDDCFKQINLFWSDSTRLEVKNLPEDKFSSTLHFGFGMWMRNNWQLWGGSRLSKYFNDIGIYHPDDMSGIILHSYHRYLNGKELGLDKQVQYYKNYWEESQKQRLQDEQEELSKYKIGDTVLFRYRLGYTSKKQKKKYDDADCAASGRITEVNNEKLTIKVLLHESCGRKGIIYYDNKNYKIYNEQTKNWEKPKKRIIKRMKNQEENWFHYEDWEINN